MKCKDCPIKGRCFGERENLGLCGLASSGLPNTIKAIIDRHDLPEPDLPSLMSMAGHAASSAVALVTSRILSPEEAKLRLDVCESCHFFRHSDRRCGGDSGCGCWMDIKAALSNMKCPRGYWPHLTEGVSSEWEKSTPDEGSVNDSDRPSEQKDPA